MSDKMLDEDTLKEYMMKEIDVIEDIIKRMAFDSFLIKGWAITLVSVTLLLKGDTYQNLIAIIPLIAFWYLDAFYLWQERLFRELYKWDIKERLKKNEENLFDMDAKGRFSEDVDSKLKIMFSQTLKVFYGTILFLIVLYNVILFYGVQIYHIILLL